MPELPEVQTVVNSLAKLKDKKILSFESFHPKITYNLDHDSFVDNIVGKNVISIGRKGKYILIPLNIGLIVCHLRMTGQLFLSNKLPNDKKHMRAFFKLNKGYLIYNDIRKFGGFYFFSKMKYFNYKVGVDPYEKKFTLDWLKKGLSSKSRIIKYLLLDQKFICGLGNIYVDEILWLTKIHPEKKSDKVKNTSQLFKNIILVLDKSIKHHGTTIINFTFDNMKTGDFRNELKVYGREGKPCFRCKSSIVRKKIAGRSTHFCKKCQK